LEECEVHKDTRMVAPLYVYSFVGIKILEWWLLCMCTALWDKILTCDNLMKKGITLVD